MGLEHANGQRLLQVDARSRLNVDRRRPRRRTLRPLPLRHHPGVDRGRRGPDLLDHRRAERHLGEPEWSLHLLVRPHRGEAQTKSDGLLYTPYTWKYTCPILAADVKSDGRLYLGGFHVRASFTQSQDYCNDVTYWTQRSVIVDPDGAGSQAAQTLTFERRNGTRGPATSAQIGARSRSATVSGESAQLT